MKPKHAFVVVLLGLVLPLVAGEAAGAALLPAKTQISLTFDDGNADQLNALPVLQKHNMHGTFYIISGSIGAPNYLTLANLGTINGQGNEIAGHTVSHPDLTTVPADEATRQICNGRAQLAAWGYPTTDFAYPYAALNPSVESIVAQCGFNSARGLGDIQSAHGCSGCDTAETTPPGDPYDLEALDEIDTSWTLAQMEQVVTTAQRNSGGWLIYTFHHICVEDVLREVTTSWPTARVVVLSTERDPERALRAARSGVAAWVPKEAGAGQLIAVLRGVCLGHSWFPPELLGPVLRGLRTDIRQATDRTGPLDMLSPRELDVLGSMVDGRHGPQIAEHLSISVDTVRTHTRSILAKLGVHSRLEAVRVAREARLHVVN